MESQGQSFFKGLPSLPLGARISQHGEDDSTYEYQDSTLNNRKRELESTCLSHSKKQKEDDSIPSRMGKSDNIPKVLLLGDDDDDDDDDDDKTSCIPKEKYISQSHSTESSLEYLTDSDKQEVCVDRSEPLCNSSIKTGHLKNVSLGGDTGGIAPPQIRIPSDDGSSLANAKDYDKEQEAECSIGIKVALNTSSHGDISKETDKDPNCDHSLDKNELIQQNIEVSAGRKSNLSNSEGHLSPSFTVRPIMHQQFPEEMNMEFHYGDLSTKVGDGYHSGDEHQIETSRDRKSKMPMKLDLEHLQLLNVGGTVEYMESLPSIVTVTSPHAGTVGHGNVGGLVDMHSDSEKSGPGTQKVPQGTIIISGNDQKPSDLDSIPIQVYPQAPGISLVTRSGILTADIATFSTQVPAILTEGDADDTEAAASFAEQFHVVTTSNVLTGNSQIQGQTPTSEVLSVMMSSGDLSKSVILTPDQQQAILGEVIAPGVAPGQTLHITIPHVMTSGCQPMEAPQGVVNARGNPNLSSSNQILGNGQSKAIQVHLLSTNEVGLGKDTDEESDKVHLCPHTDCGKVCHRAHKLKLHMLSHTGERPYKCPHDGCEWAFTTAYKLKRHERGHTGERPFVCPHVECSRRFTTAYNLKTHIRAHNRTNTIICQYEGCDKSFPTVHKYRVHERKHQQEDKPYKCEIDGCGKEFSAMGTLTSHLKSHTGERPHGCPFDGCEKRFTKASKLKLHLRTHTGERPFSCNVEGCGWSFTSAYKLKRHMRKHTGERPYVCAYEGCHKSFTRSSHLKTHTLVHTGEKPYVCPIDGCNKAFTAGSSLNVHMRKHTGEKPFRCEEDGCSKAYTTASNLRAHQKRHDKTSKLLEVSEDQPLPSDYVTVSTLNSVSNASSLVDNDTEVTYTGMHTFSSEDFTTDDVTTIPVSVHFPAGSLSAIVANSGNPLTFSTAGSHDHSDVTDEQGKGIHNDTVATVTLPLTNMEHLSGSVDVSEFVVRSDNGEPVMQHHEVSKHSDVDNLKHDGGFDLSITSIVSHLRSHDTSPSGKLGTSDVLAAHGHAGERLVIDSKFVSSHSRALEFRTPINPEDQFKPPAVIFQEDSNKSGSSDTEGETPQPHPDLSTTNQALMQITLPQEVIQIHFPCTDDSTVPTENDGSMEMETTAGHQLHSFETSSLSELQGHSLNKTDLSPYMDESCSPEPDESHVDNYPESTINLQDLR